MRRLLATAALTALLSPVLVVLPVAAQPARPAPHPVTPVLRSLAATSGTGAFSTVGASWTGSGTVEVRTHGADGWSPWSALEVTDAGPDTGSDDARTASGRHVSEAVWVGPADSWQSRARGAAQDVRVVTVDAGHSDADALGSSARGAAVAAPSVPTVFSRADWGADESLRSFNGSGCATPDYSSTIKVGFVHHTAGDNGYTADQVPAIIRGIYAYHVKTNGWCDVGYNFLVDAFGRVWEGRYGGTTRAVIGAHTGGHNTNSFGAALIGKFTDVVAPSPEMVDGLQRLFAWKLAAWYADPTGKDSLRSGGGGTSKYAAGTVNTFDVVSGHKDAGDTECPGPSTYSMLPSMRPAIRALVGAALVHPVASATSAPYASTTGVTVTAGVLQQQSWTLDVKRAGDGVVVRTYTGATSTSLSQVVDLKDASGAWLPGGAYTLALSSNNGADVAIPWTAPLQVGAAPAAPPVTSLTAITPTRVLDTRTGLGSSIGKAPVPAGGKVTVKVTGVGGVPTTGVAGVAVNLTGIAHGGPLYLSAFPSDSSAAGTSTLNLAKDQVHATLVLAKVGMDGAVSIQNSSGTADVVLDVVGYLSTDTGPTYVPVTPTRVLDTRTTGTPYGNGTIRQVQVGGQAGVPTEATAVVANVTVTGATSNGLATVFPAGTSRPPTSTLNFVRGEVATNRFVSGLTEGVLSVYTQVSRADVIVDVVGYYGGAGGSSYTPLTPARVLDTRSAVGVPGRTPVAGGSTTALTLGGRGGVPADAKAVAMTLTTTAVTRSGYVTAWSGAGARPGVSDVNVWAAHDVANLVVVQLSAQQVALYNAGGSVHLVGDVVGYFR